MEWFYVPGVASGDMRLPEDEARHCLKVLRHKPGDRIVVMDGMGQAYEAVLENNSVKECLFRLGSKLPLADTGEADVHIAIAPTRNIARFEWFLEKGTETGLARITPMLCRHSVRKTLKPERLQRILVSAAKQSQRPRIPSLEPLQPFHDFVCQPGAFDNMEQFIAVCDGAEALLRDAYNKSGRAVVLIGPEGDFSREEIREANEAGFIPVSLGPARLRTETAGLVACLTIQIMHYQAL